MNPLSLLTKQGLHSISIYIDPWKSYGLTFYVHKNTYSIEKTGIKWRIRGRFTATIIINDFHGIQGIFNLIPNLFYNFLYSNFLHDIGNENSTNEPINQCTQHGTKATTNERSLPLSPCFLSIRQRALYLLLSSQRSIQIPAKIKGLWCSFKQGGNQKRWWWWQ